jgi:hypothetical protein
MFSSATDVDPTSAMAAKLRAEGDLRACIIKDLDEELDNIENQWDLAALVVKHVVGVFCNDSSPHILGEFGKYIETLVSSLTGRSLYSPNSSRRMKYKPKAGLSCIFVAVYDWAALARTSKRCFRT